jgi:hypothetical protein
MCFTSVDPATGLAARDGWVVSVATVFSLSDAGFARHGPRYPGMA